jgi:hypothetical protein
MAQASLPAVALPKSCVSIDRGTHSLEEELIQSKQTISTLQECLVTSRLTAVYWQECAANLSKLVYGKGHADPTQFLVNSSGCPKPVVAAENIIAAEEQSPFHDHLVAPPAVDLPLPLINPVSGLAWAGSDPFLE